MTAIVDAAMGRTLAKSVHQGSAGFLFHIYYTAAFEATNGVINLI